jgi:hypothetical protein
MDAGDEVCVQYLGLCGGDKLALHERETQHLLRAGYFFLLQSGVLGAI